MSHFVTTVCLPRKDLPALEHAARVGPAALRSAIGFRLETVLEPWNENREVEAYRVYEKGSPTDFWAVGALRKEANLNPDDASLTWAQIAEAYNSHWGSDDGSEKMLIDEGSGMAYTMSTYNPDSKWDWYQIGGRWPGRYPYRSDHENLVITGERSWASEGDIVAPLHCDGGQKLALNLDLMRGEAEKNARKDYAKYERAVAGTPVALPWSTFTDNINEATGYTIERARDEYGSQPRIVALRKDRDFFFADNEDYACGLEQYVQRARSRAVPGYAMVTTDGTWVTPGDMGWWGISSADDSSREEYWEKANAYIEALPDDTWLVAVDMHI